MTQPLPWVDMGSHQLLVSDTKHPGTRSHSDGNKCLQVGDQIEFSVSFHICTIALPHNLSLCDMKDAFCSKTHFHALLDNYFNISISHA